MEQGARREPRAGQGAGLFAAREPVLVVPERAAGQPYLLPAARIAASVASLPGRVRHGLVAAPGSIRRSVERGPARALALSLATGFVLGLVLRRTLLAKR